MKMTRDFCSGYISAVNDLGREGDDRRKDWSEQHRYLKERLETFKVIGEGLMENLRFRGGLYVDAANEIERLREVLEALRDDPAVPPWINTLVCAALAPLILDDDIVMGNNRREEKNERRPHRTRFQADRARR